jgi:hypothetical protein
MSRAVTDERPEDERTPSADRRGHERVSVEIWLEEQLGEEVLFRRSGNISAGGVQLDQGFPKPVGTRVRLSFALPGESRTIKVTAEVVGAKVSGDQMNTHLQFVDISDEDKRRLEEFTARVRGSR